MGWWQGPRGGLPWFLLLHTMELRECVLFGMAVSTYSEKRGEIIPREKEVSAVVNTSRYVFGWSSKAAQGIW